MAVTNNHVQTALLRLLLLSFKIPLLSKLTLSSYLWASNRGNLRRAGSPRVCMMYEPRFRRLKTEIEARGIDVVIVGRGIFDTAFRQHLSNYLESTSRGFGEYALDGYLRYPTERRNYLNECRHIAGLLMKYAGASAIVLPKYNDDFTLEVVQAFHDTGWTTVVYDREGTVTTRRLQYVPPVLAKQAPTCDYVLTYNETHKAFFARVVELSGITSPTIIVVGNPASDEWFQRDGLPKGGDKLRSPVARKIVFFAFGEFSYIYDTEYLKGRAEVWRELLTDIHSVLSEHLSNHPGDELLYKRGPKGNRDYWAGSESLLAQPGARLMPSTTNANRLIEEADVILAFQTTALIDAMHTNKAIVYCAWTQNYDTLRKDLIPFHEYAREGALLHARSPEELQRLLSGDLDAVPIDLAARKRIRELFTTNPDGMVASRVADWIAETLIPHGSRQSHV